MGHRRHGMGVEGCTQTRQTSKNSKANINLLTGRDRDRNSVLRAQPSQTDDELETGGTGTEPDDTGGSSY